MAAAAAALEASPLRAELPVKERRVIAETSVWGIIKKSMGKSLSKISMPIVMNEPISALQRMCEELEHSALLDQAAACDDPAQRMLYVAAFAVSGYAATFYRGGRKPFNPLLGETFEFVDTERKFRFVAEQVSHHPPVSAASALSAEWEFFQQLGLDTKMRPSKLRLIPTGTMRLKLLKHNEVYEWNKVSTVIEDFFKAAKRWIDHRGTMLIRSSSKVSAEVVFTEGKAKAPKLLRDVHGSVFAGPPVPGKPSKPVLTFKGKWSSALTCPELANQVIFQAPVIAPEMIANQFGFSAFTCALNQPLPAGAPVPGSDSRFRPDQRMYELDEPPADAKKLELEQAQRERANGMEAAKQAWKPLCFEPEAVPAGPPKGKKGKPAPVNWLYKGEYWSKMKTSEGLAQSSTIW